MVRSGVTTNSMKAIKATIVTHLDSRGGPFRKPDTAGDGEKADYPDIDASDFAGAIAVVLPIRKIDESGGNRRKGKYDRPATALRPGACQSDNTEQRADHPWHADPSHVGKLASECRHGCREPQRRSETRKVSFPGPNGAARHGILTGQHPKQGVESGPGEYHGDQRCNAAGQDRPAK